MKKFNFFLEGSDGLARAGTIKTAKGEIKTPVFMPVGTLANVKSIFPNDLENMNIDIILANTYHLMLRPGEDLIAKAGGLHKFMNWKRPILTDSGGFQIWSLSKLRSINEKGINFSSHLDGKKYFLTPEKSIKIQEKLDADISMVLDECTEYPAIYQRCEESMKLSLKWAKRSKKSFKKRPGYALFGIIQGGMFTELRKECTEELVKLDFDGYAIGGLSVGENHKKMMEMIDSCIGSMPLKKPRYLMGVGRPIDIFESIERGIDMFDCVLPTRFGRNGRAFTTNGEINLRNSKYINDNSPLDKKINCYVSKNFSKSYLHHLTKNNEILSCMILSLHNIAFYKKMMCDIRNSIIEKKFKKIKKQYLKSHAKHKKT